MSHQKSQEKFRGNDEPLESYRSLREIFAQFLKSEPDCDLRTAERDLIEEVAVAEVIKR